MRIQAPYHKPWAGVRSTASKLVFGGSDESYLFALDGETGKEKWKLNLGGIIRANPISHTSKGKQVITIAAGKAIVSVQLGE